jgi:hypothetical protein
MIALAVSRATAIEGMQLRPVKGIALISKGPPFMSGARIIQIPCLNSVILPLPFTLQ